MTQTLPDNITEAPVGSTNPAAADDLYRHVNGEWLASHEIPADRPVDGTFHKLRDQAELDVKEIVESAGPDTRIGALFHSFMDEDGDDGVEQAGLAPLDADLDPVRGAADLGELVDALATLDRHGVGGVIGFWTEKDAGGSSDDAADTEGTDTDDAGIEVAYLTQTGLGLPDEAYYREEQHAPTLAAYREFVESFLQLVEDTGAQPRPGRFGDGSASDSAAAADAILAFETALAKGHWDTVSSRDADKTYNPTPWPICRPGSPSSPGSTGSGSPRPMPRR